MARELRENPASDFDFGIVAERLHMSLGHFRRLFREYVGDSPHDYLLLWRMRKAADMIRTGGRPIKAVALELGYDDPAQFSRLFKKKIGVPPSHMRRPA